MFFFHMIVDAVCSILAPGREQLIVVLILDKLLWWFSVFRATLIDITCEVKPSPSSMILYKKSGTVPREGQTFTGGDICSDVIWRHHVAMGS